MPQKKSGLKRPLPFMGSLPSLINFSSPVAGFKSINYFGFKSSSAFGGLKSSSSVGLKGHCLSDPPTRLIRRHSSCGKSPSPSHQGGCRTSWEDPGRLRGCFINHFRQVGTKFFLLNLVNIVRNLRVLTAVSIIRPVVFPYL